MRGDPPGRDYQKDRPRLTHRGLRIAASRAQQYYLGPSKLRKRVDETPFHGGQRTWPKSRLALKDGGHQTSLRLALSRSRAERPGGGSPLNRSVYSMRGRALAARETTGDRGVSFASVIAGPLFDLRWRINPPLWIRSLASMRPKRSIARARVTWSGSPRRKATQKRRLSSPVRRPSLPKGTA